MLSKKQIKILAKPYTNKRIIGMGAKTVEGSDWWSNGHVAFLDESPPATKDYPKSFDVEKRVVDANEYFRTTLDGLVAFAEVAVYPVEIRPNCNDEDSYTKPLTVIRFSDGNGTEVWANARYIAAIQKRHRKKQELTWTADWAVGVLVAHNGKPVAVLMKMCPDGWNEVPDWCLKNEYIEKE